MPGKITVVLSALLLAVASSGAAAETKAPQKTVSTKAVSSKVAPKASASKADAPTPSALAERIRQITNRPEFKHSQFGVEFFDLKSGKVLYALNGEKLFVPGSTTKLVTEGTALALLGADYRFRTRVYRTGGITDDGTLEGDLVLVAGGDPNLSGRVRDDDTLSFTNFDHGYAGSLPGLAVPGDPLTVLKSMAQQVADHGIKQVRGQVMVDNSLFTTEKYRTGYRGHDLAHHGE